MSIAKPRKEQFKKGRWWFGVGIKADYSTDSRRKDNN